ncbi:MAG: GNAT family N-acetyltransferase [Meiothermus sp.]|nr:GNAT family N-acetyltransferase [Meiothermus sp.]
MPLFPQVRSAATKRRAVLAGHLDYRAAHLVQIRPSRPSDGAALVEVAYATGFFGCSAEIYFPARALFGALWVGPYLGPAGACGLLAECEGRVLGYVLGSPNPQTYRGYFQKNLPGWLLAAALGRYPGLMGSLRFLWRSLCYPSRRAPLDLYPAHLHISLLPEARGKGLGERLLRAHLDCLRARGVVGVQLSTALEHSAALRLYRRLGLREYARWESPWLGRPVVHRAGAFPEAKRFCKKYFYLTIV